MLFKLRGFNLSGGSGSKRQKLTTVNYSLVKALFYLLGDNRSNNQQIIYLSFKLMTKKKEIYFLISKY